MIIGFKSGNGDRTCATLCLRILDGLSLPLVIGIVSILEHFKDLYISMLQVPNETEESVESEDSVDANVIDGQLNMEDLESLKTTIEVPFAGEVSENVEEIEIPESNGFQSLGIKFMNLSAATIQYFNDVSSRISQEFLQQHIIELRYKLVGHSPTESVGVAVSDFLRSDEIVPVFVPNNWTGINGIPT